MSIHHVFTCIRDRSLATGRRGYRGRFTSCIYLYYKGPVINYREEGLEVRVYIMYLPV